MASGGADEEDGGIPLDIDNKHMLLQVEHEQIQKRTFTNWINAQLSKRHPPSYVSDLFSDLRDGSQLLDLLEIMSGQPLKRQKGGGPFHQRANIETALSFLKTKSVKLVNINIADIIDGRPTVILGLVWTIILHCHIEELASALSFSSRHSSLESLASLDSWSGSPVPDASVLPGRTSPLHRRFRISARKALLMWVRDQCQRVGSSVSVKDFKSSWRSGEAFLAILCCLRPELVDLSLVQTRSNQENLEEAFHLAERELHIPRLLEPQDVDVKDPEDKSIMTYVAQFLQYSSDFPAPDEHLQVSPHERTQEMTCWLQQACQEVSEAWSATEKSSYAEKYKVFQSLAGSFTEQRRPVLTHLAATQRCPELSQEQHALKTVWNHLEQALQRCKTDLDMSLPPPLDTLVLWLQRSEAVLTEEGGRLKDHADAAKEARAQQDALKTLTTQMNHYVQILDAYPNVDDSGNAAVPPEKFDEIKRCLTHIRVTAKYQEIKLDYRESRHTSLDLLTRISAKVRAWKCPYKSQEDVNELLLDWHETVEHQGMLLILMDAVQNLKEKANTYTSKAALDEDFQLVTRQVKEAEGEAELVTRAAMAVRGMMERTASAWETHNKCLTALQTWLQQTTQSQTQPSAVAIQDMSGWMSCQAKLNEVGNFLTEVTETSTSCSLAKQLSNVNMQWAECMKKAKFEVSSEPSANPVCLQMVHSLIQESSWLLRQPLEVASVPLKACRQELQLLLKKMAEVGLSSLTPSLDYQTSLKENAEHLPQMLAEAERTCGELQRAASRLEGSLAELDHWSNDALDCYENLKETQHKGCSAVKATSKVLISRGLQLENQVVSEGQCLQDLLAHVQESSPLQHLSTSVMQERISEAVCHCQEILGKFGLLGLKRHVGEPVCQTQAQPETGLFVVTTTRHVDQIGKVRVQLQDPNQLSLQIPSHTPQQETRNLQSWRNTQDMNRLEFQMLPQPLETDHHLHTRWTQNPVAPVSHGEVYSKAQSMARSRLEKARFLLQGRIQQAIKLFGVKDVSESQAKKKQKALRILQPCILEEFLEAVEGFGSFCFGLQLQDLMLLSDSVRKQWEAATEGTLSTEEHVDSFQGLCETLSKSTCLDTHQLKELDEAQETQPSDTVLPADGRGPQLGGSTPLRATGMSTYTVPDNNHPPEQSVDSPQQNLSPVAGGSLPLHGDVLSLGPQEVPPRIKDLKTQRRSFDSGKNSSQRAKEQPLKARLLQPTQAQTHAIVRSNTVETKQDAELTVITETVTPPHEEHPSGLEALERYKNCCLVFRLQLQKNKHHLEKFIPDPVTISTLQKHIKLLQAIQQDSQAPWLKIELQYDQLLQPPLLMTRKELSEVERDWEQLTQEWRGHCMCLQSRMTSLEKTAALMESAEDQRALITQNLDGIIRESVDISSFTLADLTLVSDLKVMDDKLQYEMKKLAEQRSEEERQQPEATSLVYQALHSSVHHLKKLRQQLEKVRSAAQALDHFLTTVREVKAEIPTMLATQDPSGPQHEADWEQERHSWQEAMQERLQSVAELSNCADSRLKAAKMTLNMDGAVVTCQDVVTSLSKHVVDVAKKLVRKEKRERKAEINLVGTDQMQRKEDINPVEVHLDITGEDSPWLQKPPVSSRDEEESSLEAKRSRLSEENDTKTQMEDEQKTHKDVKDQSRRVSIQVKGEKESLAERRVALIGTLREISGAAEQLGLQEPTLPALQQRTRVLTELDGRLAGLVSELHHVGDSSSSGISDRSQTREVEDLWEQTTKAVTERLEQCCVLTDLIKRFQSLRGELSGTLQRAESTISEQSSYMGRDNLQRLHNKVKETKAELNGLGDCIEEVRSVCRKLHTHLHHIPEVLIHPFESEADSLMDHWLDISERTDSHLDNLHLCLTLWDRVLQLGAEVESWTSNKIAAFAQSPSFQTEDDITTLRNEMVDQEENVEHFHRRTTEIQSLLQSTEPPLELQVVETQTRKKTEQLKDLVSEAEDVFRQMVSAKGQIIARLSECFSSLQNIQDSLLTFSGSDVATVRETLKGLCSQLQTLDEQTGSLLEDLRVLASVASPGCLQHLSVDGNHLQEKLRIVHQLFSEVEEKTERNIQDLDRLQRESEHLEQWLQDAEEKSTWEEDLSFLQEEALQQKLTTDLLSHLVSSLQSGPLWQSIHVDRSRKLLDKYNTFHTNVLCGSEEKQSSLRTDTEVFQAVSKSTQSWIRDLRQHVDSPLSENLGIQCPVEQKLQQAKAVASVAAEGEARIEELRSTGNSLNQRLSDGEDLKRGVQETVQKTEEQWRDLLQSVEPYYRALQASPEFTSSFLARRQEARCRLEELRCQTAQLPTLFPWPGATERKQTCRLARQLWNETESLHVTLTSLDEQRRKLAEQTSSTVWNDSCWAELDKCWSGLVAELKGVCSRLKEDVSNEEHFGRLLQHCHLKLTSLQENMSACQTHKESAVGLSTDRPALETLLDEVTAIEKDLLHLVVLKDSTTASVTAEAHTSLSQQVSNLQNHKGALESRIRKNLSLLRQNNNQKVQQVMGEVSCVLAALTDLAENVRMLCGHDVVPDMSQLQQQWCTMQDSDNRLTELGARAQTLQKTGDILPGDVILTIDQDLDSLRSTLLQKKQQCAENTANKVRLVIGQLRQWSQTAQAKPSSLSQADLDEGLWLQQSLREVLSEKDFLVNCLGTTVSKKLEKFALDALNESTSLLETLVKRGHSEEPLESEDLTSETFRNEIGTSDSREETQPMCPPLPPLPSTADNKANSESDHSDSKMKNALKTLLQEDYPSTADGTHTLDGSNVVADGTKQVENSLMCATDNPVLTNRSYLINQQLACVPTDHSDNMNIGFDINPEPPMSDSLYTLSLIDQRENTEPLQEALKKVFTIVLDMQKNENVAPDELRSPQEAEICDKKESTETKSRLLHPESVKSFKNLNLAAKSDVFEDVAGAQVKEQCSEDIGVRPKKVLTIVLELQPQDMKQGDLLLCSEKEEPCDTKLTESRTNTNQALSYGSEAECQLTDAHANETFPNVSQEEVSDCYQSVRQTTNSVLCTREGLVQTIDGANTAQSTDTGQEEFNLELLKSKHAKVPREESAPKLSSSLVVSQRQPEIQRSMEPEKTAQGLLADVGAGETTGGDMSAMQEILSELQSMVEKSSIINRTPHTDFKWYLTASPGEPEIRLARTIQKVLACRYQPAKLDVTLMSKQLEEAEEHRCCVHEQVATMKSLSASKFCDPNALKRAEEQWSAGLLDASATVQVKAAQLELVKQYHKQMKIIRVFLEVTASEKEKMSLTVLGSSAAQADKLHALMQTMKLKKCMMEELLQLSSQLSVHLNDAESSGALLAWFGDVQEEWRLLEGNIKRSLRHASNSTSQFMLLMKEAEELKVKLEGLQKSSFESSNNKSDLELVCLTTDLTLYKQLYLHFQSQGNSLIYFSLGQKEIDEIQLKLQELGSLLNVIKGNIDTSTYSCDGSSSVKVSKQFRNLIIWAKQAENHISIGKQLALFPEEARIQISEMKKFQTDILSRRSRIQEQVEEMKTVASDMEKEETDQVLKTIEDLYEAIADSLDRVLDNMKENLQEREQLLSKLASMDAWLAETLATRDHATHVENVSKANLQKLESELRIHKLAIVEIERQRNHVEAVAESCKELAVGLSPGESRYLVNRLSGLWTELDGLLAHEKAASWELEELIHERTSSDEELSTVQTSLHLIFTDLEQQRFPLTQESISMIASLKHMLMEHQCQVQELKHCEETKRSSLLYTIGELQVRCKALSLNAFEHDKYLCLRRQMEKSSDNVKDQIQHVKNETISVRKRFTLGQTILVEFPLVKTQCQEAGDQLEVISSDLYPSELNSERQRIRHTVETLVSLEQSVKDDVQNLEFKLHLDLCFASELPALVELFQRIREELKEAKPVAPDEKAMDAALQRYWVIWRNMEAGMRVLEALGEKERINLSKNKELFSLRDEAMQECHVQMDNLTHACESLKNYQWAAQGAISFLHKAEATFLSAPGGFLDCTEEQRQTQQALEALEDGFQAHIRHLVELVPHQHCLSCPETGELHINILSQLLVGRAVLEAQAQLRLELLQKCVIGQQSHRCCHEDIHLCLSDFEARCSQCTAAQITSYDKCISQQKTVMLLMEDLHNLSGKIVLLAECPMPGCGAGKDGELGGLWRRWVSLRRGVGVLMSHTEQRGEEWKDITTSMEQCCNSLASLQAEVPDYSGVICLHEQPQELFAQAEMHNAGLEQEQQTLASLEHRLEHALRLSTSHHVANPGSVGKTLVKIQENVRSLKERNLLVVAAAQAEEKKRDQIQEEIKEMERYLYSILSMVEGCSDPSKQQDLKNNLSSHKAKLQCIMDSVQSQYGDIPADISRKLQEVQLILHRAEEKLIENCSLVQELAGRVMELSSGLKKVKLLLEQKSPTVNEAQNVLKLVWDELDVWHSRLMLLESEVQDLSEEQPDQAHILMDQLTEPLQLYQNTAQMAEQRTSFLSKIPVCLQEFKDSLYSATCWLDEAHTWISTPCSFTTARSLQSHANSLQLVLDDSKRIRDTLRDFTLVLAEISAVCDISTEEEKLKQNDQQVHNMQSNVLERLEELLQAVEVVDAVEDELKTMEKSVLKIRTILSSMENSNIRLTEHLNNQKVILANVHSMQRTLEQMEKCKGDLHLPQGSEESLTVFSRATLLLQQLDELENLTRQQASLVEIIEEEEPSLDIPTSCEEAFEMSNSEEEEDEDDESCRSSSSDTLTCSIPEDPEDALSSSDVQIKDIAEMKPLSDDTELESLAPRLSPEKETSSKGSGFATTDSGSETVETGLTTMDSRVYTGEAFSHKHEFTAGASVEDTRLIPARPKAPRAAAAAVALQFIEGGDKDLCLPTDAHQDLDNVCGLREQQVGTSQSGLEESRAALESSKVPVSCSAGHDDDGDQRQSWSRLRTQIFQKHITLKKVQEENQALISFRDETAPQRELVLTGSASAVHQQIHESISLLRQTVSSANSSDSGVMEELYEAVRRVLLCLDSLTDLLVTPGDTEEDAQLRLLQQECVSAELVTLAELLNKLETNSALLSEEPDSVHCLTCLQDCLHTVHLVFTSPHPRLHEHLDTKTYQELSTSWLCLLDEFDLGQNQLFPILKDASKLELCVLVRHLRESPGKKAKLQQASWSLLQGITRLLELGEECISEAQMNQVHSCSQLQTALCGHEKLLQDLGSQLAFVQHLFQREPEALKCQEDERAQLEVRAKALRQQAVEQEVAFQTRLQERTWWEDNCGRLRRVLDEVEAFISSREPEGGDEDFAVQHRLDACQQTLVQLDESRAALGLILDHRTVLQEDLVFAPSVSQTGGALELRWRSAYRWTEQEIQRCRDIQDSWTRFQTDFASVSEWLDGANKHLKTLSDAVEISDLNQKCIYNHLTELLDLSMEVEAMSVQRASVCREAAQLIRWREADCPRLRSKLSQLDVSWSQLTSGLTKMQEQLQQQLLASWPPVELLSDMGDCLKKLEARLSNEKEDVLKAKDAAQITEVLQHYQKLKAGVISGQVLLDFLCQSGPQLPGGDIQVLQIERTMFAETLGTLNLQWLHLQRELDMQICGAEQIHHTCADRERRLKRLQGWKVQQKEQLNQWKKLSSQTLIHKSLLEWEAVVGRLREVTAAVEELKATQVHTETEEVHPSDIAFSQQADSISHACADLSQQMEVLGPILQQAVTAWSCYERDLREVTLHGTRLHCALQHQRAPVLSLKQAEGHMHLLQQLQEKVGKGEELWAAVEKSFQSLIKSLQHGTAQTLGVQMEGERKRWKDVVQALNEDLAQTGATLSLWREYSRLSENCSLHRQDLCHQWEELTSSSLSPEQDSQAVLHSVEKLQDSARDLQHCVGDALEASKRLTEHLDPAAANLIQSETSLLSRDILLLNQTLSRKNRRLQDDLEEQKLFHTRLEALDKQIENILPKLEAGMSDSDAVKHVILELSGLSPSLVDIRNMSGSVILKKQEKDKLHMLTREWIQGMTRTSNMNRELQAERQHFQHFQEKCKNLKSVEEKLEKTLAASYSNLQEMLTIHQSLQAEIITGHQLLQELLCDAVTSVEKETGEKRSELVAQVSSMKERWLKDLGLAFQCRSLVKEQLHQWMIYHCGLKLLWKLLSDVDPLLSPTGPAPGALPQVHFYHCYQRVEEALGLYSTVYSQTLEAGRCLCETMTESETQSRLRSECRAVEEAWERTTLLLGRKTDFVSTGGKKWSQCQDGITNIMSDLDELNTRLKPRLPARPEASEDQRLLQEAELSLQHLAGRLSELGTMKTDLSQYVAAGDSALLEQQLEQLHGQWEELCMKVSLRRQEIADRLNAWTIFNDKNKEFCDWLTQMENKVCHSGDLSIEEMVEKLKKDCMEEINLFSENKSHLKQLGEQLLLASDEAKQTQVQGSLQEVNQRWHNLFNHIEARVKKLKETLVTVQRLDKNMSNLRSWLSRIETELSRPITYSVCHHQEIQKRLAEQQELQKDIEQHTEGVASVLSLCDVLLRDNDVAGGVEVESDSLQETTRSLDQRWRTICAMALDRRLRIEETWRLWCKFLDDYSRFEDWLKMAERTAANPNSADVLYTVAKEELKKFEGFQRQVHERLTQLELVNNQYRRLARENRTDRASQLKATVHEGNRRWDTLHQRVAAIIRRLKYFTSQREEFEGTRESMLVWLTELDLQLTNVEHFSESDVDHKMQQLNSFQKEITLNTERIDGLIVFGEGLIQKSSPQDAALIEEELEELHSYCQEVFSRLVRFHQRLSQPPKIKEPELSGTIFTLESSLELICRPRLGRSQISLPATPTHPLASPLERSGRETPDSLPLEWDPSGDVGGSSSHEDEDEEEEEEDHNEAGAYFSALSVPSRSGVIHESPRWRSAGDTQTQLDSEEPTEAVLTSTPLKQSYMRLASQCSGSIEDIKRVSLILDDEALPQELGLTALTASGKQSGVIERWELIQARSKSNQQSSPREPQQLTFDLDNITSWLEKVISELDYRQRSDTAASIADMEIRAKELKEMQKTFARYRSIMLSVNLRAQVAPELQERLASMNRDWSRACTGLQQWDTSLRKTLMRCQEFHETLHSLLLWLAHAESMRYAVDISHPDTPARALQQHRNTLTHLQEELRVRQAQQASLQALWSQLQPEDGTEENHEAQEKLHVTGNKLKLLIKEVDQDLSTLQQCLDWESGSDVQGQSVSADPPREAAQSKKHPATLRERRDTSPPRSFFYRVLRAAFPLHLLLLFLLLLPCLIPMSESDSSCSVTNNFARSFHPMLRYTNGPPPT